MPFIFSPSTGRYRDTDSGRFVSEARIRVAVDMAADAASARMAQLTERLTSGALTLAEWQSQAMAVIKVSHVSTAVVAHGGRAQMTASDWGWIGQRIKTEYRYLREFANQIEAAESVSPAQIAARLNLYGQSARVTFEAMRARDDRARGYDEERSMLHPADHCGECVAQAALGWQPIGALIPIGRRECLSNCRCSLSRRIAPAVRARHLRAVS
jgi:hypothetical protein